MTEKSKKLISRNPDIAWRVLGEHLIAITPESNKVHRFNPTGTFIWECLETGNVPFDSLVNEVQTRYDIDRDSAERDVGVFLDEVTSKGLALVGN